VAPVSRRAFRVVVTREDGHWLADVPDLPGAHTYARSLPSLDQAVREVVVLAADLPDEAMPELALDYDYHTGDPELDATALEVRRLRRQADDLAATAAARSSQVAAQLVARGLSMRDVAALLDSAHSESPSSPPKPASTHGATNKRYFRARGMASDTLLSQGQLGRGPDRGPGIRGTLCAVCIPGQACCYLCR
jgi:hypothetical protein